MKTTCHLSDYVRQILRELQIHLLYIFFVFLNQTIYEKKLKCFVFVSGIKKTGDFHCFLEIYFYKDDKQKKAKLARIRHLFHIKREKEAERKRILKRAIKRAFLAYRNKGFYIGPYQVRATALTAAIVAKGSKIVEALLDGEADPNEVDERGGIHFFGLQEKGAVSISSKEFSTRLTM